MDIQQLKQRSAQALARPNYPARKILLIHTGVAMAISLVLSLLSFLLGKYGQDNGGLGAMGLQTVISSVQLFLPFLTLAFSPFWNAGLQNVALGYAEGIVVEPRDMLSGFRRWKAVLSSSLMLLVQYISRAFVASFAATQLVVYTPLGLPVYNAMMKQMQDPTFDLETAIAPYMPALTVGVGVLTVVGFALLALPVYYRYRFVNYEIMQDPQLGGMQALLRSRQHTYRQRRKLFKIDLHFWWFFGLDLLIQVLAYGDLLLELMGVTLPISTDAASWAFLLLAMAGQVVLYVAVKPAYEVVWAQAYLELSPPEPEAA